MSTRTVCRLGAAVLALVVVCGAAGVAHANSLFSVDAESPLAGTLLDGTPISPADILTVDPGTGLLVRVYSEAELGLVPGDDIDALRVCEQIAHLSGMTGQMRWMAL